MVKPDSEPQSPGVAPSYFVEFKPGSYIFRETDAGSEMFIIEEGQVEILKLIEGQERRLALLEEGDFFGEMSILEGLPRTASAKAATDCRLLYIDSSSFDQMLRENSEIAVRMLRKLSHRLREVYGSSIQAHEVTVPPPAPSKPPPGDTAAVSAKLVFHPTGEEVPLPAGEEIMLGRPDAVTGIAPDIDLAPMDTRRSVSRRHAKIVRRGDRFLVLEEVGTANGTFVNGERVKTGVPVEVESGDEIRFGRVQTMLVVSSPPAC